MKFTWSPTLVAIVLPLATGCGQGSTSVATAVPNRSCVAARAVDPGNDADLVRLQKELDEPRTAPRAAEQLGYRFVARARLSNDPGTYTLAEQAAACLESLQPGDPAALLLKGHVLHQLHRFGEAEAIARKLVASREFVLDFGLLGDALMEQGRITEAADAYQKMIDLKPFYQSYVRAAHLRWLRGDLTGAIQLMQLAVKTASPRDRESVAWAYSRLGTYELQRGQLDDAGRMVEASLQFVPDYTAALLVRGRIDLARKKNTEAVVTLERAARLNPLPEYQWALADALRLQRRTDDAVELERRLIRDGEGDDPRTLALFLSTRGVEAGKAIELARRELNSRGDIFSLDALAWALYAGGQVEEASALMNQALREGTEDARLFLHAAVIAAADGRPADAASWARKARSLRFTLLPSELGVLQRGFSKSPRV